MNECFFIDHWGAGLRIPTGKIHPQSLGFDPIKTGVPAAMANPLTRGIFARNTDIPVCASRWPTGRNAGVTA